MPDFIKRLKKEAKGLAKRMNALTDFMETDTFLRLSTMEKQLLENQYTAMMNYFTMLVKRITYYNSQN